MVATAETGRGVVARERIHNGAYVCEYKTSSVSPAKSGEVDARGMYIIETSFEEKRGSGRLCFDAMDRLHHPGRFIKRVAKGANIKPAKPQFIRGKWRVGFLAVRDILEGEELAYAYELLTEESSTRKGRLVDGKVTSGVGEEAKAEVKGEGEIAVGGTEAKAKGGSTSKTKKKGGRRSWWCPIVGCTSGPVQKITQHFQNKHNLPLNSKESRILRKHKRAPPQEAIDNLTPNPYARHRQGSSRTLTEFDTPGPSRELPKYVPLETLVSRRSKKGKGGGVYKKGGTKGKGRAAKRGGGRAIRGSRARADKGDESGGGSGEGGAEQGLEMEGQVDGDTFLRNFGDYLESPVGGAKKGKAARQVVVNVRKYFDHFGPGKIHPERLLQLKPVPPFIEGIREEGIGSSGVLHRLDAHALALKYLNFVSEEEGMAARVQRCTDFLRTFRKSFHTEKVAREREGIEAKAYAPPDLSGVDRFLSDATIGEEFFETAERILASDSITKSEYNICLAIVAGRVLYSNGQRPAAITGAKLSEYFAAFKAEKKGERYAIIRVHSHKTGSSESAKVVLNRDLLKMMRVWEEVRDRVAEDSPFLFPNYNGEEAMHLTRLVMRYGETKGLTLVKTQTLRTAIELKTKDLPMPTQEAVTRSLSHSIATAAKHYRANNPDSGHLAFETIQGIVAGKDDVPKTEEVPALTVSSPTAAKRRRFSAEETAIICEHFQECIQSKILPLKSASTDFLAQQPGHLFVGRRAHDIYDKVRNLIGRK